MMWMDVAAAVDVPAEGMARFDVGDREITVARLGERLYAFDDRCPHMNAPLHQGKLEGGQVVCPMHKSRFDLETGKLASGPRIPFPRALKVGAMMADIRTHDLRTYDIRTEGGRIQVRLDGPEKSGA